MIKRHRGRKILKKKIILTVIVFLAAVIIALYIGKKMNVFKDDNEETTSISSNKEDSKETTSINNNEKETEFDQDKFEEEESMGYLTVPIDKVPVYDYHDKITLEGLEYSDFNVEYYQDENTGDSSYCIKCDVMVHNPCKYKRSVFLINTNIISDKNIEHMVTGRDVLLNDEQINSKDTTVYLEPDQTLKISVKYEGWLEDEVEYYEKADKVYWMYDPSGSSDVKKGITYVDPVTAFVDITDLINNIKGK